jgi:hypothetical protein
MKRSNIINYRYSFNLEAMIIAPGYEFIPGLRREGESWQ